MAAEDPSVGSKGYGQSTCVMGEGQPEKGEEDQARLELRPETGHGG